VSRQQHTVTTGLIVRLEAKVGEEEELASFKQGALPLAEREPQTVAWLALRAGASSFAIVDALPDEAGRQAHLDRPIATALLERAGGLLAEPPEIYRVEVLAAKLPATSRTEAGA
jgi:quinol monooxygenase YgiN